MQRRICAFALGLFLIWQCLWSKFTVRAASLFREQIKINKKSLGKGFMNILEKQKQNWWHRKRLLSPPKKRLGYQYPETKHFVPLCPLLKYFAKKKKRYFNLSEVIWMGLYNKQEAKSSISENDTKVVCYRRRDSAHMSSTSMKKRSLM